MLIRHILHQGHIWIQVIQKVKQAVFTTDMIKQLAKNDRKQGEDDYDDGGITYAFLKPKTK